VLDPVYYAITAVMWCWHRLFDLLLGPASGVAWALSVVFLVLTLRALLIKPVLGQLRSSRTMRALAPQLAAVRRQHAAAPARALQASRALQREHGVSTVGQFLPVLLQLPVFLGLLHVLRHFNRPGLTFEQNAAVGNYVFGPAEVRSFLEARLFGAPLSSYLSMPQSLLDSFGGHVDRFDVVLVVVPLMLLTAVATHLSARHSLRQQPLDGPAASLMRWTPWVLPLGALVGGVFFAFPIAILLYWLTNSAWTLVQQWVVVGRRGGPPNPVPAPAAAAPAPPPAPAASRPKRPGAKPVVRPRNASGNVRSRRRR
jgi:YidC/Oxa1 family membrane protein insertase